MRAERLLARTITVPRRNHGTVLAARAALAEARGALDDAQRLHAAAAELWRSFGHLAEFRQALLGRGRCLVLQGRSAEARDDLGTARAIFDRAARPLLDETERQVLKVED